MNITHKLLKREYLTNGKSGYQIAKELNVKKYVIDNAITRFKIPRRSLLESRKPKNSLGLSGFKWCSKCGKDRELKHFSRGNNRFGLDAWCKSCKSNYTKKYFPKREEERIALKSKLVIEFGNKCKICGAENLPIACYVFHHHSEKMSSKNYKAPSKILTYRSPTLINAEKTKWVMLCSNCHNLFHSKFKLSATEFEL